MMSKKIGEKKEHFSIRKLTVGAASVLIGTSLYLGGQKPATVHADPDDGSAKVTEVKTDQSDQKDQSETNHDSINSTGESDKPATTSGVKEETKIEVNENKKSATSEETNKGVQDSEQKEPAKVETGDKDQKNDVNKDKEDKTLVNSSTKGKDNKSNTEPGLDGPKDIYSVKEIDQLIKNNIGDQTVEVDQTINYHNPNGKIDTIVRSGIFQIILRKVRVASDTSFLNYAYELRFYDGKELEGDTSYNPKELIYLRLNTNVNKNQIIDQIQKFKDECNRKIIILPSSSVRQIKGYTPWGVSRTYEKGKNRIEADLKEIETIPQWDINNDSIKQIIDIKYRPIPSQQPTSPGDNPTTPTSQPTQAPTEPQPTVAPVHPEQPSEPGNVKPKPEKPAAPSHHTKNNNSGSVKPKAQKMPSKAPAREITNRVNPKAVKTTQTIAPKAQTPAAKPVAKVELPQTGENSSLSKAAILLGGAAAVIGLIGLAATRKHIF